MNDYISRKAAVKIAQKYGLVNGSALGRHTGLADCIAIEIEGLPAADVEPVRHGRWVGRSGLFQGECSVCGYRTYDKTADWARKYWTYCPNCGAKMDLEEETNDD